MMANLILDENEISGYEDRKLDMNGGMGQKAQFALSQYTSRLDNLAGQGFGPNDTSTAHAVIDELRAQMRKIAETTDDVDSMIDDLVRVLKAEVLDKENKLADNI